MFVCIPRQAKPDLNNKIALTSCVANVQNKMQNSKFIAYVDEGVKILTLSFNHAIL